jgi:hypothetical protein
MNSYTLGTIKVALINIISNYNANARDKLDALKELYIVEEKLQEALGLERALMKRVVSKERQ